MAVRLRRRRSPATWRRTSRSSPAGALLDGVARRRSARTPSCARSTSSSRLNRRVLADVGYTVRMEPGVQSPDETLRARHRLLPRQRLAARADPARVSASPRASCPGYLVQLVEDVVPGSTADRRRARTSPTCTRGPRSTCPARAGSAWTRPPACSTGEGHIPLACTADARRSAAPISGAVGPCQTTIEYSNVVRRIHEDPRVTLPYCDEQWERIDALGAGRRRRAATTATCG